ncbi:hypothetical protein Forpi1262_v018737 [Fusarium oxysporum f. sp. raphani]|uniref:Uncharacterized protein n=1 Tax=Fusarium oxysporum f. sp. raphani TaxID=96318 RepID=A0A8J5NFA9_FUSOX|nr:hypothetical protein Forpi1262_v018737 [Fusarium oxysporum f. sp. raphani]
MTTWCHESKIGLVGDKLVLILADHVRNSTSKLRWTSLFKSFVCHYHYTLQTIGAINMKMKRGRSPSQTPRLSSIGFSSHDEKRCLGGVAQSGNRSSYKP